MKGTLNGKTAIITGATGGIGSAIAKELYSNGANVILTGRREGRLQEIKETLMATNSDNSYGIHCIPVDLESPDADKLLIDAATNKFGYKHIDILVNNAAKMDPKLFLRTDAEFINKMLLVNFIVPMRLMQRVIPYMILNKYGRIINITSLASFMGDTGMTAYAATKGALTSLSRAVATEYASRGITVNCVAPGLIETDALKQVSNGHRDFIKQQIPAKRYGHPEEIASIVGHLASEKAAYINGQVIHVNGGLYR